MVLQGKFGALVRSDQCFSNVLGRIDSQPSSRLWQSVQTGHRKSLILIESLALIGGRGSLLTSLLVVGIFGDRRGPVHLFGEL